MSSAMMKPSPQPRPGQGSLPSVAPSNQSILLDKLHARRSTPDSEALASSDDEAETHRQDPPLPVTQPPKPVRRASWLNDTSQSAIHPRKGSFASSSMSPTTSHPNTPSAETGVAGWPPHAASSGVVGRSHAGSASLTWGTGIWNSERKEPPSRLAEVLPSPTSSHPQGSVNSSFFSGDGGPSQTSPAPRDQGQTSQIPFAIPLHPTPKTYRSQSYSVGQLDPDVAPSATTTSHSAILGARNRGIPHSGLQHRPSRPSMLSEMSNEGGMLGKVKEVEDDDDDDSTSGSAQGGQHQSAESKTIEMLARENAILRQHQYQNLRLRPRASTAAAYGLGNGYNLQESVPEESDYAIDELDESNDASELAAKRAFSRRMSEYGAGPYRSSYTLENRKLENVKKAFWQSSLGFPGLGDIPQSRRHSFADVPTRQPSIGSIGEQVMVHEPASQDAQHAQDFASPYPENPLLSSASPVSVSYFSGGPNLAGSQQALGSPTYGAPYPPPYSLQAPYLNRPPSPHRNMYGLSQPRHTQRLHIVLFKCARADVFYIQEGTGLTVKPGDLVIVEADRGTDLGTVAKDNVDWQTAKELKEHYAEEHYRWLMMYSQNAANAQEGAGAGLLAASNGMHGSAVGGMGPPSQHHIPEPNAGELKPKLIKRHAQNHEIHALRDKEGNEAKAKRVCMQKVKEHGLNMEILDAEFQMDWKKLTFYYFADSYINFNSLVTDLFKIYKTRIWMSAINPASFATPTLGLQAPSGIGPGAVGVTRGSTTSERRQPQQQQQQEQQSGQSGPPASARGFQGSFSQGLPTERPAVPAGPYSQPGFPYNPYSAFGNTARAAGAATYTPSMMQSLESYPPATGFSPTSDYQAIRARFPGTHSGGPQHDQPGVSLPGQNDWVGSFQGLSLNSR
ncbi:Protein PSP1 [Pleurostoma richardsiae]|uniref:Protein PSP1 n=1 Tax=Pleurostoma richardsiae TaxID=41990 RepID=A0AA38RIA0_9PEZI|nr:Protein PSP1 [Pleurostoma richardsiae]